MLDDSLRDTDHCVVGSGPAGVACAQALLDRGARVTMLDAGIVLEEPRRVIVDQMSALTPSQWSSEQLATLKGSTAAGTKGIPLKLAYGSDYPYRETERLLPAAYDGVALRPSLAQGGFSTVWGAAMMPYSARDMADWPIAPADLAEHYSAITKLTGLSGIKDDLERIFPLYTEPGAALALSRQATTLYQRLSKHRDQLRGAGIHFGQARVAVKAGPEGCVRCGLCMYGCPYGFVYNADQTLRALRQHPNFSYRADHLVTRTREAGDVVFVTGQRRVGGEPFEIRARRAYLATGVISTAGIVLRSCSAYERPVYLKDSQYYLFPLLLARRSGDVRSEAMHTLSQMFIEIFDEAITPRSVHLQVYSYNDLVGQAVRGAFGPLARLLEWLARALEDRMLIVQGYLHSDHSSKIGITLTRDEPDRLRLQASLNPEVRPMIRRVLAKLRRHCFQFGAWPLGPMLQVSEPGRGFHSGGSFPMRARPGELETDTLGRLSGWERTHIVDASVLPDVPATQITFSVMANAHRIGWNAASL
ncbi:MAG TPA: GMC oxidoreductase [Polyangiaceae bacterium]|nr:GMC oxidoreductase [Polyangiaceae bacterium]